MKNQQEARYKAYSIALAYLKDNESITGTLPLFSTAFNKAMKLLNEINDAENKRAQKLKSATDSKLRQHEEVARLSLVYSAMLQSYAEDKGNTALRSAMSFNQTDLAHATPHDLSNRAANILEKMVELQPALKEYGLTDDQLSQYRDLLGLFATGRHAPRTQIAERKQAGILVTENLSQLTEIFAKELDSLMQYFRESHPEFYNQYRIKRTVVNPGRRKTRVEGVITDNATGAALQGVSVVVKDTAFATVTAADGSYNLNTPSIAEARMLFTKEGYQPAEITVKIKRGQALQQNLALVK